MKPTRINSIRVGSMYSLFFVISFSDWGMILVAVDFIQEHILHQGDQSDESALEQMKDEQISDAIRRAYKAVTGNEVPVKDK